MDRSCPETDHRPRPELNPQVSGTLDCSPAWIFILEVSGFDSHPDLIICLRQAESYLMTLAASKVAISNVNKTQQDITKHNVAILLKKLV